MPLISQGTARVCPRMRPTDSQKRPFIMGVSSGKRRSPPKDVKCWFWRLHQIGYMHQDAVANPAICCTSDSGPQATVPF